MDKLQAGVEQALRYYHKGMQHVAFGDLYCGTQGLFDSLRERLAGVTAIDKNTLNA